MDLPDEELKQPLVDAQEEASPPRPGSGGANRMMRNPPVDAGAEEEKEETLRSQGIRSQQQQQKMPYAAPNVHPYAVPQYQAQGYGGGAGNGWGRGQDEESGGDQGITVDIVFSGMYTLAAAFTIIQGFGMLIHFTYASGETLVVETLWSESLFTVTGVLMIRLLQSRWGSTPWLSVRCCMF